MFRGVTSTTDPKIADVVRMSPLMTETTLGLQTMMCCVAWCGLLADWASVHQAEQAMVTGIRTKVTEGVGGGGM